jgi:hypothetical protein
MREVRFVDTSAFVSVLKKIRLLFISFFSYDYKCMRTMAPAYAMVLFPLALDANVFTRMEMVKKLAIVVE